jgi:hypothetical protein
MEIASIRITASLKLYRTSASRPMHTEGGMRREEITAARLIEKAIPGAKMVPNVHQSHNEWDYDLVVENQRFPVEITRSTSAKRESMYDAILGKDGERQGIPRKHARFAWMIDVTPLTRVRAVRQHADRLLADVEAEGRNQFDVRHDIATSPAVRAISDRIGVRYGESFSTSDGATHQILLPSDSATLTSAHVVEAVERELCKSDNRTKLGRSQAPERHLFVHITDLSYPAQSSMKQCGLPSQPLQLPPEMTHVWVSTYLGANNDYLVWRYDFSGGWSDLGLITST